ncbi:hypothetical protein KR222_010466 [Zaprionus bogoriensis]|nr:hypothetical protein KR222_010466 [Zaprionus bogoriensis]
MGPATLLADFERVREVQIENVLNVIKSSIQCIKISLILPKLADDIGRTRKLLRGTLYSPAIRLLSRLYHFDVVIKNGLNHEVLKVINYFHTNYNMVNLCPRLVNELSIDDKKLVVACETLNEVAERHLNRSAKSEINLERQLRVMYHQREKFKANTLAYKKKLRSKYIAYRWKQAAKATILDKLETDLASTKWQNSIYIQREIDARSNMIYDSHKETVSKQKDLETELEKTRDNYHNLLAYITGQEKEARNEKNKLLIQLQLMLQKYDKNIAEKIRENLELEDQYKVAKKELDMFMVGYRKEEAVYKQIVVQYEMEEQRKQQQRILVFMMNRAARKIQEYWLKWRRDQRIKAKRANRKKKKQ